MAVRAISSEPSSSTTRAAMYALGLIDATRRPVW